MRRARRGCPATGRRTRSGRPRSGTTGASAPRPRTSSSRSARNVITTGTPAAPSTSTTHAAPRAVGSSWTMNQRYPRAPRSHEIGDASTEPASSRAGRCRRRWRDLGRGRDAVERVRVVEAVRTDALHEHGAVDARVGHQQPQQVGRARDASPTTARCYLRRLQREPLEVGRDHVDVRVDQAPSVGSRDHRLALEQRIRGHRDRGPRRAARAGRTAPTRRP